MLTVPRDEKQSNSWQINIKQFSSLYASETSTLFKASSGDDDASWRLSDVSSEGLDSCLAAACKTRLRTSEDEGEVGSPTPFVSSFPAAHEKA